MLRFAGYMMATAGGGAGVWAAAGSATNALVSYATTALESAMVQGSTEAVLELQASQGSSSIAAQRRSSRKPLHLDRAHSRYVKLSNGHRHRQRVEALDLALPCSQLSLEPGDEVLEIVFNCVLLWVAGNLIHGWLRILQELKEKEKRQSIESAQPISQTLLRQVLWPAEALANDVSLLSPFYQQATDDGEVLHVPAMAARPKTPEKAQGMHSSDLSLRSWRRSGSIDDPVYAPVIKRTPSLTVVASVKTIKASSTSLRSRDSEEKGRPSIHEIRNFFLEKDTINEEPDLSKLNCASAPDKRRNFYVPVPDTLDML